MGNGGLPRVVGGNGGLRKVVAANGHGVGMAGECWGKGLDSSWGSVMRWLRIRGSWTRFGIVCLDVSKGHRCRQPETRTEHFLVWRHVSDVPDLHFRVFGRDLVSQTT